MQTNKATPIAWYWEDKTGHTHFVRDRPDVQQIAQEFFCEPKPLFSSPQPISSGNGMTLATLQAAHVARQEEWCPDVKPDLSFRGNELGGECGEAQNVIKKLERERQGWRGSRDTVDHLGQELADVIHCAILVAITANIDLQHYVIDKFNDTSMKNGLATILAQSTSTKSSAEQFDSADFYWRTMDPDDSGEYPQDCINRAGFGLYCVAEIASSFTGPKRFGFTAPVLDIHSDEEEFLHFETQADALDAVKARREAIAALEAEQECCIACDVPLEEGDLVYWDASDTGHLHAHCCGPERSSYVNENGEPLKDDEPIPTPFEWKPDHTTTAPGREV